MTRPSHLQLVTPDYRPPTPPPQPPATVEPPIATRPPPPRKARRRARLPPCWHLLGVRDHQDELGLVLENMLIQSTPRAMGRAELKQVWEALAHRARQQGREPILLYRATSGRELSRFRSWLGYPWRKVRDGDSYAMEATTAYPLPVAINRLRATARHPAHLARLRGGRYAVLL